MRAIAIALCLAASPAGAFCSLPQWQCQQQQEAIREYYQQQQLQQQSLQQLRAQEAQSAQQAYRLYPRYRYGGVGYYPN